MSIATQISRIQTDRNTIRNKLVELGLSTGTANLDALATAIEGIAKMGAVAIEVKEGETYTIPAGYHDGSGTVAGVAGGGNYSLQNKNVTPSKAQQSIVSDEGYYGLASVTVAAIPDAYQDVTSVTAAAGEVLAGKIIVDSEGKIITGTMANNGSVDKTLDVTTISYTIPAGYHSGTGTVKLSLETKSVTPSKSAQEITPTTGKVLSKVTVEAIPDAYQDVTGVTTVAEHVLDGDVFVNAEGEEIEGTMANNGAVSQTLDSATTSYTVPEGYHNGEGTVSITTETKSATPTKSAQTISPSAGKVLSKVTVDPIPDNFIDTTDADAEAANILAGKTAYVNTVKVEGTMANNGDVSATMDGLATLSVTIPAGYTTGGTISLTSDIEEALAAI